MHDLQNVLYKVDPYASLKGRLVALSAGDIPDVPANWSVDDPFISYERNLFGLARQVLMWWTPARIEHEALRMAGDAEGPSILSEEAYAFRAIFMHIASLITESVHVIYSYSTKVTDASRGVAKKVEMFRDT